VVGTLQFATLKATAVSTKTIAVNTTVTAAIDVTSATTTQIDIGTNKITLQGTINNTGGAANPYKFNGSGAEVIMLVPVHKLFGGQARTIIIDVIRQRRILLLLQM